MTGLAASARGICSTFRNVQFGRLSGCGWSPAYRFDAEPEKGLVRFAQQAEIRQATGQDWKGVHLTLASADPGNGLSLIHI